MKSPFSESRHFVPGLCEGMKTAAIYRDSILQAIKAQLGLDPCERDAVQPYAFVDTLMPGDPGGDEYDLMKNRKKDEVGQPAQEKKII